jgi:hypothetical protein
MSDREFFNLKIEKISISSYLFKMKSNALLFYIKSSLIYDPLYPSRPVDIRVVPGAMLLDVFVLAVI